MVIGPMPRTLRAYVNVMYLGWDLGEARLGYKEGVN